MNELTVNDQNTKSGYSLIDEDIQWKKRFATYDRNTEEDSRNPRFSAACSKAKMSTAIGSSGTTSLQ